MADLAGLDMCRPQGFMSFVESQKKERRVRDEIVVVVARLSDLLAVQDCFATQRASMIGHLMRQQCG